MRNPYLVPPRDSARSALLSSLYERAMAAWGACGGPIRELDLRARVGACSDADWDAVLGVMLAMRDVERSATPVAAAHRLSDDSVRYYAAQVGSMLAESAATWSRNEIRGALGVSGVVVGRALGLARSLGLAVEVGGRVWARWAAPGRESSGRADATAREAARRINRLETAVRMIGPGGHGSLDQVARNLGCRASDGVIPEIAALWRRGRCDTGDAGWVWVGDATTQNASTDK